MKKAVFVLFLTSTLCFTSCIDFKTKKSTEETDMEDYNTVVVPNAYSVEIPKFMRSTTGLNEEASLQYQNIFKETYVIVIDEPKSGFVDLLKEMGQFDDSISLIQNYREIQMQLLSSTMYISQQSEPRAMKINGLDAEMVEVDATVDGIDEDISYLLTFIEGTDDTYMMMAWTLESKKDEHKKTFETIAESFKLVD